MLEPDAVFPLLLSVVGMAGTSGDGLAGRGAYIHKVGVAQGEAHPSARRSSKRAA
jgi:hypothetical protein